MAASGRETGKMMWVRAKLRWSSNNAWVEAKSLLGGGERLPDSPGRGVLGSDVSERPSVDEGRCDVGLGDRGRQIEKGGTTL